MKRKVIISCALTGSLDTRRKNPAVPVTPEEIANSAVEAALAGAAIVHVHVRDPDTTLASMEIALYAEVVERIRSQNQEVLLNLTTGAGARLIPDPANPRIAAQGTTLVNPQVRAQHIAALRPDICSLDAGTLNFGEYIFVNTPDQVRYIADVARASNTKPEIEVFDLGHIELAKRIIKEGRIEPPPFFQICLGISYGAAADVDSLAHMRSLLPDGAIWSAFGIGQSQFDIVAASALLGGHVRVGLEDNLYLSRGRLAQSNAELVQKAARILQELEFGIATPVEAREILGLPRQKRIAPERERA